MVESTNYDYENYLNFSTTQHTVDEILERILNQGSSSVCFSYLCRYCNIPKEKMEDFILISMIPVEKNPFILSTIRNSYEKGLDLLRALFNDGELRDRIDWFYLIRYQRENISDDIFNHYCNGLEKVHALESLRRLEG